MKTIATCGLLGVALFGLSSQVYAQSQASVTQKAGSCSITTNGNSNNSKLVCVGLDPKVASQIKAILDGTSRTEAAIKGLSDKLDQIVHNVSDRRLTPQQIQMLEASARSVCANFPAINVTASIGNQEAQRFAMDFVNAFKAVGCKADLALPIPGLRPDIVGVAVGVRNTTAVDPQALELDKILSDAGVQHSVGLMESNFFPGESFVLVIGAVR